MTRKDILEAVAQRLGITTLTPMQEVITTSDRQRMVILAPTGSGKTVAFAVVMLRALQPPGQGHVQALVLAPSRELVIQIAGVIRPVAAAGGYKTTALLGGHSVADEQASLAVVPDIVVATPGRLLDHLERGHMDIHHLRVLVLDEYDKALELGFLDQMESIVRRMGSMPPYIILTSATPLPQLPPWLPMDKAKTYDFGGGGAPGGQRAAAEPDSGGGVTVLRATSPDRDKLQTLARTLRSLKPRPRRTLVFVNHREAADRVFQYLLSQGVPAGIYHGGMDQQQRQTALELLANGTTPVLVTTDLASRGIDIPGGGVDAVVHYHLPLTPQAWTHRNGRTARMGSSGTVVAITAPGEELPAPASAGDLDLDAPDLSAWEAPTATIYVNAGRRLKIGPGDLAGYFTKALAVPDGQVGRIMVADRYSLVAVPAADARRILAIPPADLPKLNAQRVRLSKAQ